LPCKSPAGSSREKSPSRNVQNEQTKALDVVTQQRANSAAGSNSVTENVSQEAGTVNNEAKEANNAKGQAAIAKAQESAREYNINKRNEQFDADIDAYERGDLGGDFVFSLGKPPEILRNTGFPNDSIELSAKQLTEKIKTHGFKATDIKGLVASIQEPIAVFEYGDKNKAQNVVVELKLGNKNILVGVHFNQSFRGTTVSDVRTLFGKDTHEIANWIDDGKLLYANIEKLHGLITPKQIHSANLSDEAVEPIIRLLEEGRDVKHSHCLKLNNVETGIVAS
jgi:hypothetical protein